LLLNFFSEFQNRRKPFLSRRWALWSFLVPIAIIRTGDNLIAIMRVIWSNFQGPLTQLADGLQPSSQPDFHRPQFKLELNSPQLSVNLRRIFHLFSTSLVPLTSRRQLILGKSLQQAVKQLLAPLT